MKKLIILFAVMLSMPFCGNALIFTATNDDGVEIKYKTVGSDNVQVMSNNYTGFVRIPETVTYEDVTYTVVEITSSAFTNCSGLQYVQLPATITNVGNSAFRGCDDLDSIRILAATPPSTNSMGLSLNASQLSRLVVIVPDGCIKAYRENRWWTNDNRIPLNITSDNHTRLTIMLPTGYEVKFGYKDSWNKTPFITTYFGDNYPYNHVRDSYDINFFYTLSATRTVSQGNSNTTVGDNQGFVHFDLDGMDTLVLQLRQVTCDSLFVSYDNGASESRFIYALHSASDTLRPTCIATPYEMLEVNNVSTAYNIGCGFSYPQYGNLGFHVPAQSELSTIYSSNIWFSASTTTYENNWFARAGTFSSDWKYGPITGSLSLEEHLKYHHIWAVSRADIDDFIAHVGSSDYTIPENIATWPGNGPDGPLAPFYDADSNGIYEPSHGDYPLILGDKMLYTIFNDHGGQATGHDKYVLAIDRRIIFDSANYDSVNNFYPPININDTSIVYDQHSMDIEIHSMVYAFDEPDDTALNNTVFVRYKIFNRSQRSYHNAQFGAWTDFDIGYSYDDYVGCDVTRGMYYAFNGLSQDQHYPGIPPAQSCTILGGALLPSDNIDNPHIDINTSTLPNADNPISWFGINGMGFGNGIADDERYGMTGFVYYENSSSIINGEPTYTGDYYNYLNCTWKNGQIMKYGGNAINSGTTDLDCRFMFPDDSDPMHWGTNGVVPDINPNDWTEVSAGNSPGDRRGVASSGPFTFEPGESQIFDLAYTTGFGTESAWSSVDVLRELTDNVRRQFIRDTTDSGKPFTYRPYSAPITVGIDEPVTNTSVQLFPNPATDKVTVRFGSQGNHTIHIYDIRGSLVRSISSTEAALIIDISTLPAGVYIIRGQDSVNKLIKK